LTYTHTVTIVYLHAVSDGVGDSVERDI